MKDEIVLYQPDESVQLEVRVQDESVWLSQQQMAELFATDRTSILKHIRNIYKTLELDESATCAFFAQVQHTVLLWRKTAAELSSVKKSEWRSAMERTSSAAPE